MSEAETLGWVRLGIAVTGITANIAAGLVAHELRRRLAGKALTRFERRTFNLSLRTGAVRAVEHACYVAIAGYLVSVEPAISWPSFLAIGIQLCVILNDVQVISTLFSVVGTALRESRTATGNGH